MSRSGDEQSTSNDMNISYQRIGGSTQDAFVDPFATDTETSDRTPTSRIDYNLSTSSGVLRGSGATSGSSGGGLGLNFGGSSSNKSATNSSAITPSGPVSLDHLNSTDLAAAMSSGILAGNAFSSLDAMGMSSSSTTGGSSDDDSASKYLHYERRSLWAQASYNIGYSYFSGVFLGGAYGFLHGVRTSPNKWPRVLLNSILNGSGKFGAKSGNAFGMLALIYTFTERQFEDLEIDKLPLMINNIVAPLTGGRDLIPHGGRKTTADTLIPYATAFATGCMFFIPRAATMRGVEKNLVTLPKRIAVVGLGGIATMAGVGVLSVISPHVFGHRSPFRFA